MGLDIYLGWVIKKKIGFGFLMYPRSKQIFKNMQSKIFLNNIYGICIFFMELSRNQILKKFIFCKKGHKTGFKRRDSVRDVLKKCVKIYSVQFICTGNHKIFKRGLFARQHTGRSALYYKTINHEVKTHPLELVKEEHCYEGKIFLRLFPNKV